MRKSLDKIVFALNILLFAAIFIGAIFEDHIPYQYFGPLYYAVVIPIICVSIINIVATQLTKSGLVAFPGLVWGITLMFLFSMEDVLKPHAPVLDAICAGVGIVTTSLIAWIMWTNIKSPTQTMTM